jgi:nitroreductase
MKKISSKILPTRIVEILRAIKQFFPLLGETIYWMCQDLWHSYTVKRNSKENLAELMVANHVLEKGITMPGRNLGFGYEKVRSIISKCREYIKIYSPNHIEIQTTIDILQQYYDLHIENHFELPGDIIAGIIEVQKSKLYNTKLCYEITKSEYFASTDNFKDFALSRHSVRWYSDKNIDDEDIINAIQLAQTAPSACNRQEIRVYIISAEDKKKAVLELQNGNRGFGHLANRILLITTDMGFWKCKNRTSAFLDAGIFTMNLLYALHYYKICACTLNAHLSIKTKKKLRNIVNFSKSEIPVVFITIGNAPEKFMVTGSQRVEREAIYKMV